MRKDLLIVISLIFVAGATVGAQYFPAGEIYIIQNDNEKFSNTEAGFEDVIDMADRPDESAQVTLPLTNPINTITQFISGRGRWAMYWKEFSEEEKKIYENWQRPPGPAHVGVQVGHWKNSEVPDELNGLKTNGSGATGGGKTEKENYQIGRGR